MLLLPAFSFWKVIFIIKNLIIKKIFCLGPQLDNATCSVWPVTNDHWTELGTKEHTSSHPAPSRLLLSNHWSWPENGAGLSVKNVWLKKKLKGDKFKTLIILNQIVIICISKLSVVYHRSSQLSTLILHLCKDRISWNSLLHLWLVATVADWSSNTINTLCVESVKMSCHHVICLKSQIKTQLKLGYCKTKLKS